MHFEAGEEFVSSGKRFVNVHDTTWKHVSRPHETGATKRTVFIAGIDCGEEQNSGRKTHTLLRRCSRYPSVVHLLCRFRIVALTYAAGVRRCQPQGVSGLNCVELP